MKVYPESEFTPASEWAPHPEWWHATDGDSTEVEVSELVAAFVRALQPDRVLETGTAFGQTAQAIGRALAANGHGRLDTLEPDPERADFSRRRCAGLPVTVHETASLVFVPDGAVDFLWLDSLLHLRADELRRFRAHASDRCVVGFHDMGPKHGMRPSIEALVAEGLIRPLLCLRTPRGVGFAEVVR